MPGFDSFAELLTTDPYFSKVIPFTDDSSDVQCSQERMMWTKLPLGLWNILIIFDNGIFVISLKF